MPKRVHRHAGVFPARAGMSPVLQTLNVHSNGFPRPRGDEPVESTLKRVVPSFSPPARG